MIHGNPGLSPVGPWTIGATHPQKGWCAGCATSFCRGPVRQKRKNKHVLALANQFLVSASFLCSLVETEHQISSCFGQFLPQLSQPCFGGGPHVIFVRFGESEAAKDTSPKERRVVRSFTDFHWALCEWFVFHTTCCVIRTPFPPLSKSEVTPRGKERKLQRVLLATQCAKEVLPQPGGPQRTNEGKRSSCTSLDENHCRAKGFAALPEKHWKNSCPHLIFQI